MALLILQTSISLNNTVVAQRELDVTMDVALAVTYLARLSDSFMEEKRKACYL